MAAWELAARGYPVTVLEKESTVGGLAASIEAHGNLYDFGTHHFHTDDPALLARITKLMDGELIPTKRDLQIKFGRRYFQYPLKVTDIFLGLPPQEWILCLGSFLWTYSRRTLWQDPPQRSAEDVIVSKYGRRLYDIFFRDYTTKFWGVPPSALSAQFALQRIPRLDALAMLKKLWEIVRWVKPSQPDQFVEDVVGKLYYHPRGIGEIYQRMAEEIERLGGRVCTETRVEEVARHENGYLVTARGQNGKEERWGASVISTLPIQVLVQGLRPPPPTEIEDLAKKLRYRSLVVVGLQVARPRIIDCLFLYFRDKIFNRIAEPKNSGLAVEPPDHTVLLAELSCNVGDEVWSDEEAMVKAVVDDLEAEGLCRREEVTATTVLKAEHAYPIYHVGYEENLDHLKAYVSEAWPDLYLVGRQGTFTYINMHVAMKMALEAVGQIRHAVEGK